MRVSQFYIPSRFSEFLLLYQRHTLINLAKVTILYCIFLSCIFLMIFLISQVLVVDHRFRTVVCSLFHVLYFIDLPDFNVLYFIAIGIKTLDFFLALKVFV